MPHHHPNESALPPTAEVDQRPAAAMIDVVDSALRSAVRPVDDANVIADHHDTLLPTCIPIWPTSRLHVALIHKHRALHVGGGSTYGARGGGGLVCRVHATE